MALTIYTDDETSRTLDFIKSTDPKFNISSFFKKCIMEIDKSKTTPDEATIIKNLQDALSQKQMAENQVTFWQKRREDYIKQKEVQTILIKEKQEKAKLTKYEKTIFLITHTVGCDEHTALDLALKAPDTNLFNYLKEQGYKFDDSNFDEAESLWNKKRMDKRESKKVIGQ